MKSKTKILLIIVIGLFLANLTHSNVKASSETESLNPPKIDLTTLDTSNKGIKKSLLSYSFPISKFNFSLRTEDNKVNYSGGDLLAVKGSMDYQSNIKEETEKYMQSCKQSISKRVASCADQKCVSEAEKSCELQSFSLPFIHDLGIYAQIWRKDDKESFVKGDNLIDEFYIAKNLIIKEGQEHEFSVSWEIPEEIPTGTYYLSLSPIGSERFNFMGFPFNPSSKAISYGFEVKNNNSEGIVIDKNSIRLNDQEYNYINPVPFISDEKVEIDMDIENLNQKDEKIKVEYKLSKWSQEDKGDILNKKVENLIVSGKSKSNFHFTIPIEKLCTTCNVKVIATTEKSQSQSNIRFVTGNKGKGLFRFLGIGKTAEEKLAPVFCPRSAHLDKESVNSTFKISLFNEDNNLINSWSGKGKTLVNTFCYIIPSITLDDLPYVKIKGEILSEEDQLDDQKEVVYSFLTEQEKQAGIENFGIKNYSLIFIGIAILLIIMALILVLRHKKKIQFFK